MSDRLRVLSRALVLALQSLLCVAASAAAADKGTATLAVYEGCRFQQGTIVAGDDPSADVSFYVNRGRQNAGVFALAALGAKHIREYETRPDVASLTLREIASWDDSVNAPSEGYYYVVLGHDGGAYLVHVEEFANQGKAASLWKLRLSWQRLELK